MVFSSILFLAYFLPCVLLLYFLLPKKFRNWTILASSVVFYAFGEPWFVFVLLASTILDFQITTAMYKSDSGKKKKQLLAASIVLNVGLLLYFKYANFFVDNINLLLEASGFNSISWLAVALPIGISFYTFQTLSYAIDVYRGEAPALKKLHHYLMYIMMFPQLIAGPIVRYGDIAGQIVGRRVVTDDFIIGFSRFAIGLAKKVLIANVLGKWVDYHFVNFAVGDLGGYLSWMVMLAYTFQIYFDFSGYSDMAIGLGRMFGFRFPENFNNPYISRSITEFWRRWHITLGSWMKDYLYIPLGGNQKGVLRNYLNLITVFLISGFWHGASWNFVIWGAYHGIFLILDRLFLEKILRKIPVASSILTFIVVIFGWVFFRVEAFADAIQMIRNMFAFSPDQVFEFGIEFSYTLILAIIISFVGLIPGMLKAQEAWFSKDRLNLKESLIAGIGGAFLFFIAMSVLSAQDFNPFIYFRF